MYDLCEWIEKIPDGLPLSRWTYLRGHKHILIDKISYYWDGEGSWNCSSWTTGTYLHDIDSTMSVGDRATQGARTSLQWRHNGLDGVSNHQPHQCLLNRLFGRRSKKTPKLRVTGLCVGNSPGTGEFPTQMASNAENVSIWWRHHDRQLLYGHISEYSTLSTRRVNGFFYFECLQNSLSAYMFLSHMASV